MLDGPVSRVVDLALFAIANLANLLLATIFLARTRRLKKVEHILGLAVVAMALPAAAALVLNAVGARGWWWVLLPLPFILHCVSELLLDYVLKLPFRSTRLLGPYLGLYYLAMWGLIGYSFLVGKAYGLVTLATYFLCLAATWYSYTRVGHGQALAKKG
jgi:hypothetical protein